MTAAPAPLRLRRLGRRDYRPCYRAMREFTDTRRAGRDASAGAARAEPWDELWLLEHAPVYTLGLNGKPEHLLAPGDVDVVASDRGGQVTYHGPGQLIVYCLFDLRRSGLGVRPLVTALEQTAIELLARLGVGARARADAPGVYVDDGAKIASLGLRVRRGCSYHGLSLNVEMDLAPFRGINPCGYRDLRVTQLRDLGVDISVGRAGTEFARLLARRLAYRIEDVRRALPAPISQTSVSGLASR